MEQNAAPDERHGAPEARRERHRSLDFPVVAVGASAGGLDAFIELLGALADDLDVAFVFIQHLDPSASSKLTEILARSTSMDVVKATDGMVLGPRRIHTMPPNCDMAVSEGALRLTPRNGGLHQPIDDFMRSLAEDQREGVIGVILSGTGSDGVAGVEWIRAAGGSPWRSP